MKALFGKSEEEILNLTFLAMMRTTTRAESRRAAAILSVMDFVDATTNTIPQKADPRSAVDMNLLASFL
jgi:hypothetical protein